MLRNILIQAGQNPSLSWKRFRMGIVVFVLGAATLYMSQRVNTNLYWPGAFIVVVGFGISMWGYWGIFANRFAHLLYQRQINAANDPFANPDKKPKQD
jgi:hypothetical protein